MSSMNLLEGLTRTVVYMTHNQLLALVCNLVKKEMCGKKLTSSEFYDFIVRSTNELIVLFSWS